MEVKRNYGFDPIVQMREIVKFRMCACGDAEEPTIEFVLIWIRYG